MNREQYKTKILGVLRSHGLVLGPEIKASEFPALGLLGDLDASVGGEYVLENVELSGPMDRIIIVDAEPGTGTWVLIAVRWDGDVRYQGLGKIQ